MKIKTVDIQEVEGHFRELFEEAAGGEEIIVSSEGKVIARIVPPGRRTPGLHEGQVRTSEDFDEPLDPGIWLGDQ
jgi:antitoxin (DNA-binding transcriptional repressor) of toxin-antitoxin stability system